MPPVIPDKIPCNSIQEFLAEASTFKDVMVFEETEESWDRLERGLTRFSAVVKGGGYQFKRELVDVLKGLHRAIINALNSERTRLSTAALDCIGVVAPRIGLDFEPLVSIYVPPILRLCTRTNKVYVTRSQATIALIIGFCQLPSILPHLLTACKESKIASGRTAAVENVLRTLKKWDWSLKELQGKITIVEEVIRTTSRDKDAGIRQLSRQVFEVYKNLFPERLDEFIAPLTPVTRKYLELKPEERGRPVTKRAPATSPTIESNSLGLNVRGTSSRRVEGQPSSPKSKSNTRPRPPITSSKTMPPPSTIPNKDIARSRPPSCTPSQEDQGYQEGPRLLSSTSSTLSAKSVPASSKHLIEHQPPIRLVSSQTRSVSVTRPALTSSGPARRVRRVVSIEQTNRPDLFAMAKKAATRSIPQTKDQLNVIGKSSGNTGSVSFPSSDPRSSGIERRGAQRVPRPLQPPVAPSENGEEKTNRKPSEPAVPVAPIPKRETKPSIFRRAASADAGKDQKTRDGFAPRRGGVLQPTLSQLNKQKPPVSSTQSRPRVVSTLKRSVTQKVAKSDPQGTVAKAETKTGGSQQIQTTDEVDNQIVNVPSVTESEEKEQTANHSVETQQEPARSKDEIEPPPVRVEISEEDTLATEGNDAQIGFTTKPFEEEIRSGESTPAPETPSSSILTNKETSKDMWENIKLVPEIVPSANDISINAEAVANIPESDKSPEQVPLTEVLITE